MLIDTHCHVQFKAYEQDREIVIQKCKEKEMILNVVGTQQTTSQLAVTLAEQHDHIYATIGLHPIQEHVVKVEEESTEFTSRGETFDIEYYEKLAQHPKVIAIGETGLDAYHIPSTAKFEDILEVQKKVLVQHIQLAEKYHLPLVFHVRDAHEEMIACLQEYKKPIQGVVHCFTGNWEQAEAYIEKGLYLGFTGVVTFPPKKNNPQPQEHLLEVVKKIPIERIVIETDSPYLAPQAYRGKRAEPWMVEDVARCIAKYKELSFLEIQEQTTANAKKLFTKIIHTKE